MTLVLRYTPWLLERTAAQSDSAHLADMAGLAIWAYLMVFISTMLGCRVLIGLSSDRAWDDVGAVQATHSEPRSRLGSVAFCLAFAVSAFFVPQAVQETHKALLLSLIPVFLAGLAEDLGYGVSPKWRLVAAALSSLLAVTLLQAWVGRADVPGFDWLLGFMPVAISFTMFATAGVCNAFNLIDGLNGLASGTGIVTAIGLAAIAHLTEQAQLASISFMLIAALMGFLVFNYPQGKIFLGDAGAYSLGHALAWFSVILMFRVPDLTPWAVVLVFFWPLADTFFAIYRRRRSGRPTDQPDRLHFHHLLMRCLEVVVVQPSRNRVANPLATLLLMPFVAAPVLIGVLLWNKPLWAFCAVLCFGALFMVAYLLIGSFARKLHMRSRLHPHAFSETRHSIDTLDKYFSVNKPRRK